MIEFLVSIGVIAVFFWFLHATRSSQQEKKPSSPPSTGISRWVGRNSFPIAWF